MELKDLTYKKQNIYTVANEEKLNKIFGYCEGYKKFLDESKTEREAVETTVAMAEKAGFTQYVLGENVKVGDKKYYVNKLKNIFLFKVGKGDIAKNGIRVLAAHIDSPRLDLKHNPLYEEGQMSFFKTHYYGGIKKYQWTTIPLAIHGVVVLADGNSVKVNVGEDENDPVFYINDLLPHMSQKLNTQPIGTAFTGENLNILCGCIPVADGEDENSIKLGVLKILNEKYGIKEEDFLSAELSVVPAAKAKDVGFDRGLIGSYGHDDRSCAYASLTALLDDDNDENTTIVILADKEEIGSEGVSGMQCMIFEDIFNSICNSFGKNPAVVRSNSKCLSADVTAAYDPNFPDVYEKNNNSWLSCGAAICKFTGSGGKSGSSDASCELLGFVRKIFAENGVIWQAAEMGKVDVGGGGTVAKYIAKLNIDTVDIGVPVVSMHAPYEVVSKADEYATYEAFRAFIK